MPLRDHFRPPLADQRSWDALLGQWPAMIVLGLNRKLPTRYVAGPHVHLGSFIEIDVAAFENAENPTSSVAEPNAGGCLATAVWAPPRPTMAVPIEPPEPDTYEVRVHDTKEGRKLVAAIEIVSPSNKDRPERRHAFVAKCVALLQDQVCVTIVDVVTSRSANLYAELMTAFGQTDPSLAALEASLYGVTCRQERTKDSWFLQAWAHPLQIGQPLPTLPIWLADNWAIPLDLEASYEETCQVLRIP